MREKIQAAADGNDLGVNLKCKGAKPLQINGMAVGVDGSAMGFQAVKAGTAISMMCDMPPPRTQIRAGR
jgi:hypothetical protein